MEQNKLLFFEKPHNDEAYFDYIYRIAKNNGFPNLKKFQTWLLFELYGYKICVSKSNSGDVYSKLLDSLSVTKDTLLYVEKYSTSIGYDLKTYAKYLESDKVFKYCPICLSEIGYVRYIWSFKDVNSCHKHSIKLVSSTIHPHFMGPDEIKSSKQFKLDIADFKSSVLGRAYLKYEAELNSIKYVFSELFSAKFELSFVAKISKYWSVNNSNYLTVFKNIKNGFYIDTPFEKRLEKILDDLLDSKSGHNCYDEYLISRPFVESINDIDLLPSEYLNWARNIVLSKNSLVDIIIFNYCFQYRTYIFNLHDICHFRRCSKSFDWIYLYSKSEFNALSRFCNLAEPLINFDHSIVEDYKKECLKVNSEGCVSMRYPTFSDFCTVNGLSFRVVLLDSCI